MIFFSVFNSEYQPKYLYRRPYAHIINVPWYVAVFFMTCKRNIFSYWYASNFVHIAGEYHISTMDGGSVPMHVMQLVGRIDHEANAPFYNRGKWFSTDQSECEIGPSSPVFNAARRINHIRHVAGSMSPILTQNINVTTVLKRWYQHRSGFNTPENKKVSLFCCFDFNLIFWVSFIMTFVSSKTFHWKRLKPIDSFTIPLHIPNGRH